MEALGREMVKRGKEIEQMFNKSEAGSSRSLKVPSVSSRQPTPVKKDISKVLSTKDKKANSVSSVMERLSNTSKAKSEFKKCSKNFCPCFEAMKPAAKTQSSEGSSDDSDSLKVNRLMSQISQELAAEDKTMKPAAKTQSSEGSSDDSDSMKVNHLMSQISQELAAEEKTMKP